MWIARDSNGKLFLHKTKPVCVYRRETGYWHWQSPDITNDDIVCEVFDDIFPDLKWKDEPIEVELVIV